MSRTHDEVLAEVTSIFCDVLDNERIQLTDETNANDNTVPGWDSLSHIEIVLGIEKHFGITFNFAELQKFKNVGEMCQNIAAKLAKKP
jgi:acyl carrier protein